MSAAADLLRRHIDAGHIPGGIILRSDGRASELTAEGRMALDGPPMRADAIMRIQSMTKPITTVATLQLVEAGVIGLDDPVDRWLPELADRVVLRTPEAEIDDTVPARRSITVRDLLTNASGYGMHFADTPWNRAMAAAGVAAGPEPVAVGADEWVGAHAPIPLAHQPGDGFRYHNSFGFLGVLLSRLAGLPLGDFLRQQLFDPLGMTDTGSWVPADQRERLPAAYRYDDGQLFETEPMGGGHYAGEPPYDVSHGELVSTAADYARFVRMLRDGTHEGRQVLGGEWIAAMQTEQVTAAVKTPDSFFPSFWDSTTWGFGGAVVTAGAHAGRFGWSGGQGTDFYLDTDGSFAILLTQIELGPRTFQILDDFQSL